MSQQNIPYQQKILDNDFEWQAMANQVFEEK
jgi:hypothetical protein